MPTQNQTNTDTPASSTGNQTFQNEIGTLGIIALMILFSALSVYVIIEIIDLWPGHENKFTIFGCAYSITSEQRMFILVSFAGMLGAMVHIIASFSAYLGNEQMKKSWIPWFLLRPFIGAALAIVFYLLFRGGIISTVPVNQPDPVAQKIVAAKAEYKLLEDSLKLTTDTLAQKRIASAMKELEDDKNKEIPEPVLPINQFGILAISALAGMFSKRAGKKLEEVFDNMFNVKNQEELKNKLEGDKDGTKNPDPNKPSGGVPVSSAGTTADDGGEKLNG